MSFRIMLDSNIFDNVAATPGLTDDLRALEKGGELEIVSTHVQDDQLKNIPDLAKRKAVLAIPRRIVPTTEFVLGTSRLDQACLGDGEAGGIYYDDIQINNPKHVEDALIALAAAREVDVLVTHDKQLSKKIKAAATNLQVWVFHDLIAYVDGLKRKLEST